MRCTLYLLGGGLLACPLLLLAQDARAIAKRAVELDLGNMERIRGYVFETREVHTLRRGGVALVERDNSFEVNLVSGEMFWRQTTDMGRPIEGERAAQDRKRLELHLAQAASRGIAPNERWIAERAYLDELPDAYDWKKPKRETVEGRECFLLEGKPRRGWEPRNPAAWVLADQKLRLWVDAQEFHWVRAEWTSERFLEYRYRSMILGRFSLPYSTGLVMVGRVPSGVTRRTELQRLEDGTWVPRMYESRLDRRGGYLDVRVTYSNYRRFEVESKLLP